MVGKYVILPKEADAHYAKMSDEEVRGDVLSRLADVDGPQDFVLDHMRDAAIPETSRQNTVYDIAEFPHWINNSRAYSVLMEMAVSEKDEKFAMLCLDTVRKLEMKSLRLTLQRRMANQQGNPEITAQLLQEDERWISLVNGNMLPAFLRRVPPVFEVKGRASSIRVLAFGDYGVTSILKEWKPQAQAAAAMRDYEQSHPFDFGITLGDNFYSAGMESPDQPRWEADWERFYGPLGIAFYASLGNHDWYGPDSPAAEILHTSRSPSWHMPSPYYTFTAGPAQFFAIDSNEISAAQQAWLKDALEKSSSPWKIVYGHHPPYFAGLYGSHQEDRVVRALMPVLKGRADVYIAGHDHNLEHLKPVDGVNLFIAGGGGAGSYEVDATDPVALFAKQTNGFAVLEINEHAFTLRFIDTTGKQIYETTLHK